MLSIFDGFRDLSTGSIILRLVLSILVGTLVGLERSYKNKSGGFRTHILVCLGSTVAAMTGLFLYLILKLPADMSRIPAQVITGLGFIGGGTIFVTRNHIVKGLTTAAGLWSCGVVGLALGSGFYEAGIIATILILFTQTAMSKVIDKIDYPDEFTIALTYEEKDDLAQVLRVLKNIHISITNMRILGSDQVHNAILELRAGDDTSSEEVIQLMTRMKGIISAETIADKK